MIPVKLRLANFMCYRSDVPPLLFDGIRTACICGDNGNGKSALIDAITWAVWGKARARSNDELVASGEVETTVEFDFAVKQQVYRIIRKHTKPRNGRQIPPILELQIADQDGFRIITGNNVTQTQQEIIRLLHMDYDTFINSAYLRQGHADEFTTKRPGERKEVLANILGLSVYDELEEQARSFARQRENECAQLESSISDINIEIALKPDVVTELEITQNELSKLEETLREQESRLKDIRRQRQVLEDKKLHLAQIEEHIAENIKAVRRWHEQIRQHQSRLDEYQGLFDQRNEIEIGYARLTEIRQLRRRLDENFRQVAALDKKKYALERAIKQAEQKFVTEHALIQNRIGELELVCQTLAGLREEMAKAQAQLPRLNREQESLSRQRQTEQELRSQVHHLESSQVQLKKDIADIEEKLGLLVAGEGARCPLCESDLGIEGLHKIQDKFVADKLARLETMKQNQSAIMSKKAGLDLMEREIGRLEAKLAQEKTSIQSRIGILTKEIAKAEEAAEKINEVRQELADIEQRLARRDFAALEQETLQRLENELVNLKYDPVQDEETRNQLKILEQYEIPRQKLAEADRLVDQEKQALARAEEAVKEQNLVLENDTRKKQDLERELELLPALTAELSRTEAQAKLVSDQYKQAQERVAVARARLEHLNMLELKKKEKERALVQVAKEEGIYKELIKAFGKGGIQAQLIEIALPEIELEANRLLSRMTDNKMQVKIETQKETKRGDVIETLDINISDETGTTRNYETFSGGEAFRINFAIRIALSRLLARRAGAPLPTLIIDEGFGTQDAAGIEKIKEAINSIQDDFEKILVITHIDEMKDAFPTRIDVIKTAEGSTVEVG